MHLLADAAQNEDTARLGRGVGFDASIDRDPDILLLSLNQVAPLSLVSKQSSK